MINVNCTNEISLTVVNNDIVADIAKRVLESMNVIDADLTFIFASDKLLSGLKRKFFNKDHLTDIIAFRLNNYSEKFIEGEIYISLQRVKENSSQFNQPYQKEISRLVIHGCLHLMGYDDKTSNGKKNMTMLENKYLTKTKWDGIITE
jgi:rRNA maturation RNase YbeY